MLEALKFLATTVSIFWLFALAGAHLGHLVHQIRGNEVLELIWRSLARLHQESWLFAPPGLLIMAVGHWHSADRKWMFVFDALNLFNWWFYRNWPDDNVWKRRGKKAKEAVERRAGRLVVVPAVSPS